MAVLPRQWAVGLIVAGVLLVPAVIAHCESRRPQPVIDVQPPVGRVSATPGVGNVLDVAKHPAPAPTDRVDPRRPVAPGAGT